MKIYTTTIKNKRTKNFINSVNREILKAKLKKESDIYIIDEIIYKAILHLNT
jgi:hypothetical protein